MKAKLLAALGFGLGTLVYEVLKSGTTGVEWPRVGFVTIFMFVVSLLLPDRFFKMGTTLARAAKGGHA